jgi:hypothetical protein
MLNQAEAGPSDIVGHKQGKPLNRGKMWIILGILNGYLKEYS